MRLLVPTSVAATIRKLQALAERPGTPQEGEVARRKIKELIAKYSNHQPDFAGATAKPRAPRKATVPKAPRKAKTPPEASIWNMTEPRVSWFTPPVREKVKTKKKTTSEDSNQQKFRFRKETA